MDKEERLEGETSTVRTHDRGEISGKPAGAAEPSDATAPEPIRQQEIAHGENAAAHEQLRPR